jgi:hypothetical protein
MRDLGELDASAMEAPKPLLDRGERRLLVQRREYFGQFDYSHGIHPAVTRQVRVSFAEIVHPPTEG